MRTIKDLREVDVSCYNLLFINVNQRIEILINLFFKSLIRNGFGAIKFKSDSERINELLQVILQIAFVRNFSNSMRWLLKIYRSLGQVE